MNAISIIRTICPNAKIDQLEITRKREHRNLYKRTFEISALQAISRGFFISLSDGVHS